jgi:hypothetical protein
MPKARAASLTPALAQCANQAPDGGGGAGPVELQVARRTLPPRAAIRLETWPRGRRHSPAKGAYGLKPVSRVRIPPSPPDSPMTISPRSSPYPHPYPHARSATRPRSPPRTPVEPRRAFQAAVTSPEPAARLLRRSNEPPACCTPTRHASRRRPRVLLSCTPRHSPLASLA